MDALPHNREVRLRYRGAEVTVRVVTVAEEIDMKIACWVKRAALKAGLLPPLSAEDHLVPQGRRAP